MDKFSFLALRIGALKQNHLEIHRWILHFFCFITPNLESKYEFSLVDPVEKPGGSAPLLFLANPEPRSAEKGFFFWRPPPPYLRVWMPRAPLIWRSGSAADFDNYIKIGLLFKTLVKKTNKQKHQIRPWEYRHVWKNDREFLRAK